MGGMQAFLIIMRTRAARPSLRIATYRGFRGVSRQFSFFNSRRKGMDPLVCNQEITHIT